MSSIENRAIITGGAGFIGSHLVRKLVRDGWEVTIIDDGSTGELSRVDKGVQLVARDMTTLSEQDWRKYLSRGSTVFHLAAKKLNTPGVSNETLVEANVNATARLANAAKSSGVRKVIFASSLYVYDHLSEKASSEMSIPRPRTMYGMTKLAGEGILRAILGQSTVSWTIPRFFFVYGPGQFPGSGYKSVIVKNFELLSRLQRPIIFGSGNQSLDYIYIDDAVEALMLMTQDGLKDEVFNVSSGNAVSVRALIDEMIRVSGIPDVAARYEGPDWTEGTTRAGSHLKLTSSLGWSPLTSLREGLQSTWEDIRSNE